MGLIEQISASPNRFTRITANITTAPNGVLSGSLSSLGGAYVLLNATADTAPCRIRLYSTSESVNLDRNRPQGDFSSISDTTGLIADIVLSNDTTLIFNPPVLGFPLKDGATWFNISSSATVTNVRLEAYPFVQTGDSTGDKQEIKIITDYITTSSYGVSGSISSSRSFVILTGSMVRNFGFDPNYRNGSSGDGTGWQYLLASKSASDLTISDGVVTSFPGTSNAVAAKISTRTSAYEISSVQQKIPVASSETYRVSGYVYGNNTTSDTSGGNRYPVGYYVHLIGATSASIGYQNVVTGNNPSGWQYVSGDISIGVGTASIQVGPYIDGPYPSGSGLSPACTSEQDSRGCPGYGWFAGLSVVRLTDGVLTNFTNRTKLYSTPLTEIPTAEFTRSISSIPADNSKLIGDFLFESSSISYNLAPVVEGYTWNSSQYSVGTGRLGYQVLNVSSGSSYTNESFVISLLTHKLEN